jgi:hypothetical protein
MNRRIIEYKAVYGESDVKWLNQEVSELIGQGYQPFGGISVTVTPEAVVLFAQTMVKYVPDLEVNN